MGKLLNKQLNDSLSSKPTSPWIQNAEVKLPKLKKVEKPINLNELV